MLALEDTFGPLARLLFLDLVTAMSAATDAVIPWASARALGRMIGIDPKQTEEIVRFCLENEMLAEEEGQLTNARVIADQEQFYEKQQKQRQDSERKRTFRPTSNGASSHPPPELPRNFHGTSTECPMDVPGKRYGIPDTDTDTVTDTDLGSDLRKGGSGGNPGTGPPPDSPPGLVAPPETELERWAEGMLQPADPACPAFMATGRRPMKKYPELYLTRGDLLEIRELYERSGLPPAEYPRPFKKAVDGVKKQMQDHRKAAWRVHPKSWLIGWCFQDALKELRLQNDMKRSESYLRDTQ